jgi:hypothetical protein
VIGIKKDYLTREKARYVLWGGLILTGVATFMAFFMFSQDFIDVFQIMKSRSWSTHEAFVYESKTEIGRVISPFRTIKTRPRIVYWCSVSYLFQVRGLSFIGKTRIFESKTHKKIELANQDCEKIPKNSYMQVKFDPDDPNWSCLYCTMPVIYPILVASVICTIGLGLFMFFAAMNVLWPEPERWI